MKNNQKSDLYFGHTLDLSVPSNWEIVPLEEVLERIIGGGTPSKSNPDYWNGSIPWLTIKDMRTSRPENAIDYISEVGVSESATNLIPADTVIMATRIGLGKVVRVPYVAAINQDLKALITLPGIDKGYLEFWLLSISNYLQSIGSGTTVKGIGLEQVRTLPFPLAPLQQQQRIVAEIEKQFSRLDKAVTNLQRVKANLKRYKAAILKAAVEGKLTEEWRKQNPDVEPASKLLKRILAERRTKWEEAELAKMKAQGKYPRNDKWKNKYGEPINPTLNSLFEIPPTWSYATLDQTTQYISSGSRGWAKYYAEDGDLFIRAQNIKNDKLGTDDLVYVNLPDKVEGLRTLVQKDDILITITGANVTKTAHVTNSLPQKAYVNQHVSLTRPVRNDIAPYLFLWIICPAYGRRILERAAYGAGKPGLNLTSIRELMIALPPIEEQIQINSEFQSINSAIEGLEEVVATNLQRSQRLRQSVLSSAFSGNLTPTDPNLEPASVLLDRIRKQKLTAASDLKKQNRVKKVKKVKTSQIRRPLLDIVKEHRDGISPEFLLASSDYTIDEVDGFYAELSSIFESIVEDKPAGKDALGWPHASQVTLRLKDF